MERQINICELKNKEFLKWQYDYIVMAYNDLNYKIYENETTENEEFKEKLKESWLQIVADDLEDYENMIPTFFILADNIETDKAGHDDPYFIGGGTCNCSWGGFCNCKGTECVPTLYGCGVFYTSPCVKKCIQHH
ncbi:MAG: bacteriocin fulvocin C-related protein [Bacteroidales bacterium]|nr:bacteriocin fulvocin C-related protein [Bacteroidales bacterium]